MNKKRSNSIAKFLVKREQEKSREVVTLFSHCKDNKAFISLKGFPETSGSLLLRQLPWGRHSPGLRGSWRWAEVGGVAPPTDTKAEAALKYLLPGTWRDAESPLVNPQVWAATGAWRLPQMRGGGWWGKALSCSQRLIFITCRMLSRLCKMFCFPRDLKTLLQQRLALSAGLSHAALLGLQVSLATLPRGKQCPQAATFCFSFAIF